MGYTFTIVVIEKAFNIQLVPFKEGATEFCTNCEHAEQKIAFKAQFYP